VLIGVISSSSQSTVLWSQMVYVASMLLSGMMVPGHLTPGALQKATRLLPGTYAMEAIKGLGLDGSGGKGKV
jgi:ABC-type uncharacterized transport system permease subunit